jgi:hypothetical protein
VTFQGILDSMWASYQANPKTWTVAFMHTLNAICTSIPMPSATDGKFYKFLFRLANKIPGNYARANASLLLAAPKPIAMLPPAQKSDVIWPSLDSKAPEPPKT